MFDLALSAFLVFIDELDYVLDLLQSFSFIIGDLDVEFLFNGHDHLDDIQAVGTKVVSEMGFGRDLGFLDTELLHDDTLEFSVNLFVHNITLDLTLPASGGDEG